MQVRAVHTQFPQAHTHLLHSIWVSAPSSNTSSSRAHSSHTDIRKHRGKEQQKTRWLFFGMNFRYFFSPTESGQSVSMWMCSDWISNGWFLTVCACLCHYFSHMDGRWVSDSWWTQPNSASSLRFHPTALSKHRHTEIWETQRVSVRNFTHWRLKYIMCTRTNQMRSLDFACSWDFFIF